MNEFIHSSFHWLCRNGPTIKLILDKQRILAIIFKKSTFCARHFTYIRLQSFYKWENKTQKEVTWMRIYGWKVVKLEFLPEPMLFLYYHLLLLSHLSPFSDSNHNFSPSWPPIIPWMCHLLSYISLPGACLILLFVWLILPHPSSRRLSWNDALQVG